MKHLILNEQEFKQSFPEKAFQIRHELSSSPLFALPRLIELARSLPPKLVEYNAGNVPVSLDPNQTPMTGLSIEETIRRIEECNSWLVLKYVEKDSDYNRLLDECLDQVRTISEPLAPRMSKREGFIFISSPNSVTPYHIDPEHNFLLQIRGLKTVHLFDYHDRDLISDEELENFHSGGHRNLKFKDEYQQKAITFNMKPGDAVHFPVNAPHWVKNGPEVSISFSITFRSSLSERLSRLHQVNNRLRKMGLKPRTIGQTPWIDRSKDTAFRVIRKTRHLIGKDKDAGRSMF